METTPLRGTRTDMLLKAPAPGTLAVRSPTTSAAATPRGSLAPKGRASLAARLPERAPAQPTRGLRPVTAKTVGSFVPRLTKPAFERYGFSAAALITDWSTIVGADIARYTMPERLKWPKRVEWSGDDVADAERGRPGATLVLAVASGRALDVQYKCAQLAERINAYFGYRAVSDIRIVQVAAVKPATASRPMAPAVQPPAPPKPREELAAIAEPSLRAALERMAQGLGTRKSRP